MNKTKYDIPKLFAWPTYFVAFLLVVTPTIDFLTNVWPLRFGDAQWRYGSAGLLAGFLLTPLLGMMFALGASMVLKHRLVLRFLSYLNVAFAALLFVLVVFFALDVLEVRATVPEEARGMFRTGAAKAVVKHLTMAAALIWLGIVGIRTTRSGGKMWGRRQKDDDAKLVRSEGAAPLA